MLLSGGSYMENDSKVIVVNITEVLATYLLKDGLVISNRVSSLLVSMLDEASKGICTNSLYEELLGIVIDKQRTYMEECGILNFENAFQHSLDTFLMDVTNRFSLYGLLIMPSSSKLINRTLIFRCIQS